MIILNMKSIRNVLKRNAQSIQLLERIRIDTGQAAILTMRSNVSNMKNLWDAEVRVFSQWGEHGILDYLCEILSISRPKVIEIGAGDFMECNSRFLGENRNAKITLIDNRADLVKRVNAQDLRWKTYLQAEKTWVTTANVGEIVNRSREKMCGIDILSLDLDGNDYWILDAIDLQGMSIIIVEYNALFGGRAHVTVPMQEDFDRSSSHFSCKYYGASLPAFVDLLSKKGFEFVGTNRPMTNAFFVRASMTHLFSWKLPLDPMNFVDCHVREARDRDGKLRFASKKEEIDSISRMPVINLITSEKVALGDVI